MSGKTNETLSSGVRSEKKRPSRTCKAGNLSQTLSKLRLTLLNQEQSNLNVQAVESELLIQTFEPTFLHHFSAQLRHPSIYSQLFREPTTSSLKVFSQPQNETEFTIIEKHSLQSFQSSVISQSKTGIIQICDEDLRNLVQNILNSWQTQFELLDKFFSSFATWLSTQGLRVTVEKTTDDAISELKLAIWKLSTKVSDVSINVFSKDWTARPKLVVDVRAGQKIKIKIKITVRNEEDIQAALRQMNCILCSHEASLVPSSAPPSPQPLDDSKQLGPKRIKTDRQYVADVSPMENQASVKKTAENKSCEIYQTNTKAFQAHMGLFCNQQRGLKIEKVSEKRVIFNGNIPMSLDHYTRIQLPSGAHGTSFACKLTVDNWMGNLGFSIKEQLCHGELFAGGWERLCYLKSIPALGTLIKSWEVQVSFLKDFFRQLVLLLESHKLNMTVSFLHKLLVLKMKLTDEHHLTLFCQLMVPFEKRPMVQIQVVQSGQASNGMTFLCQSKSHISSMLERLKCLSGTMISSRTVPNQPYPTEELRCETSTTVGNEASSPEELYKQLESILNCPENKAPVSLGRYLQEIPKLKRMVANLQQNNLVNLQFDSEGVLKRIQAYSGPYNLKIHFRVTYPDGHIKCRLEIGGPWQFGSRRPFFLRGENDFVPTLCSCLSVFCWKAERLDHIVVEVLREEEEVKKEQGADKDIASSETDYWAKIENIKEETDV